MNIRHTARSSKAFIQASVQVQKAFLKQTAFLQIDLHHPSLHAKKYSEAEDLWQARVNKHWRFYFRIEGNAYVIQDIIKHPK